MTTVDIKFDVTLTAYQTIQLNEGETVDTLIEGLNDGSIITTIQPDLEELSQDVVRHTSEGEQVVGQVIEQRFEDNEHLDYEILGSDGEDEPEDDDE